jgi:predicted nucleic acid-binding protein
MIKALLDINVILDVLQQRKPHYQASAEVLSLCADEDIKGYISAISFGTIQYLLKKDIGRSKALSAVKHLRSFTRVASVDEKTVDLSLQSKFSDFEDALQYYSAINGGLSHILTRNKKDFSKAELVVMTPREFLSSLGT